MLIMGSVAYGISVDEEEAGMVDSAGLTGGIDREDGGFPDPRRL